MAIDFAVARLKKERAMYPVDVTGMESDVAGIYRDVGSELEEQRAAKFLIGELYDYAVSVSEEEDLEATSDYMANSTLEPTCPPGPATTYYCT